MAKLSVDRLFPKGAVPKGAGMWGLGAAFLVVLILIKVFGGAPPTRPPRPPGEAVAGQTPKAETINNLQDFLNQKKKEISDENRRLEGLRDKTAAMEKGVDTMMAGSQDPTYNAPPSQPPEDPFEMERKRLALELYKREKLAAFARPEGLALTDYQPEPNRNGTGTEPETSALPRKLPPTSAETSATESADKVRTSADKSGNGEVIREGTILETVLINRLDSTFSGPVIVQVSTPVPSRDRQTWLIPKGTRVLGETRAVNATGQSRVAVVFHRLIRPDDVAISLDKFTGLNQIGETGLKDKVNHHYLQIFGVSIALGVIGAAAQGTASYGYQTGGWDVVRGGAGSGVSQAAMQVMQKFLNIPPTVTIREGHRVKVHFTQDLEVPPYGRAE